MPNLLKNSDSTGRLRNIDPANVWTYPASLRQRIRWSTDGKIFTLTYPAEIHAASAASAALLALRLQENAGDAAIRDLSTDWQLELSIDSAAPWSVVRRLFARLNGTSLEPNSAGHARAHVRPRVSCIIVLFANDIFVRNQLVPSILRCSSGHAIEIVIVYNGLGANLKLFKPFRVVPSSLGLVAAAYNRGVAAARGEYIALFHDDCMLSDTHWIDKCIRHLRFPVVAVAPEIRKTPIGLDCIKCVPLFMRKKEFVDIGGFDERNIVGFEDLDFTCSLRRYKKTYRAIDLDYVHFDGMSTALLYDPNPQDLKAIFGYLMLPPALLRRLCISICSSVGGSMDFQRLLDRQKAYLLGKNRDLWLTPQCEDPAAQENLDNVFADYDREAIGFQNMLLKESHLVHS
jgi:hypothetical protein